MNTGIPADFRPDYRGNFGLTARNQPSEMDADVKGWVEVLCFGGHMVAWGAGVGRPARRQRRLSL